MDQMDQNESFPQPSVSRAEVHSTLRELQGETILLVLPALYICGIILIDSAERLGGPPRGTLPAIILFLLPIFVWVLHESHYLSSAWTLGIGCFAVNLLLIRWSDAGAAMPLLALPVGLTAVFVSLTGGALAAAACTIILLWVPAAVPVADHISLVPALVGMWGVVWLIWLTRRPLLRVAHWSWSSYEHDRHLLEKARGSQAQLKRALQDLADANVQLRRLNQLAQGLRLAAEEAKRVKQQFVGNVSHELRTPLNMIIGYCEMIMQEPDIYGSSIPAKLLADLDVIHQNSQHLAGLIDDVLDLSQIEAGQMALSKEHVPLAKIVEAAARAVRPLFDSKRLYLELQVPDDLPPVFCDGTRIRQVVLNLLSNAGRFTERGGVHVRAWQDGHNVTVSVSDTGPGIRADARDELFQPFHQVDGSIRRQHGGSGLGLSISKSFVELHGGRIWLESVEGTGTTFFFRLPSETPPALASGALRWFSPYLHHEERTHPPSAQPSIIPLRFVVLETRHTLERLLTRYVHGAEIVHTESLQEAVRELESQPAQALVVSDSSVESGLRSLADITALPDGTPVIVCSIPAANGGAGAFGVSDYLVKPVSRGSLLRALDRLNLRGKELLLVDDEIDAIRLFRRMLISSDRSYRVLKAQDGQEALRMLREHHPAAMLLDLVMPNMDGFRLLEEKGQDPALRDIPVVVISARDPAGQAIVSNALAVTQKNGFSMSQLLRCINAIAGAVSATTQAGRQVSTGEPAG